MELRIPGVRQVRRIGPAVDLLRALRSAYHDDGAAPDPDQMVLVQDRAHRVGGIASLAAEVMASYTGVLPAGRPGTPPLTLAGRELTGWDVDGNPVAVAAPPLGIGLDVTVARLALPLAMSGNPMNVRTALRAVEQLGRDVVPPDRDHAVDQSLIEALNAGAPDLVAELTIGRGGVAISRSRAGLTGPVVLDSVLRLIVARRVVHGRLGAATDRSGQHTVITHWEHARSISTASRSFVAAILDPGPGEDSRKRRLATAAGAVGIGDSAIDDLTPMLDSVLAPARARMATIGPLDELAVPDIRRAPDPLGAIYAIADLVAACRVDQS